MIILLYLLRIPSPVHCLCGCGEHNTTHGQKWAILYLRFDGHHFWQEAIYGFKRLSMALNGYLQPLTKNFM